MARSKNLFEGFLIEAQSWNRTSLPALVIGSVPSSLVRSQKPVPESSASVAKVPFFASLQPHSHASTMSFGRSMVRITSSGSAYI